MSSRTLLLAASLSFLVGASAWAADPVFPPGSRIGLVPPPDMVPSRGMAGFQNPKTGAAIVLIEMPAEAYPSVVAGFTDEALKSQGFTLAVRETPKVGGSDGILVSGEQDDNGKAIPKTVLIAADAGMTALVVAQAPSGSPPASAAELRAALATVAFRPALSLDDQMASLPFRLADLAGFRPVRVMAGNSVLLTDGPKDAVKEAEQPILIVAQSFAPAPRPSERDAFARALLGQNTFLKDAVFERAQGFRQGGSDWHELVAKAKDGVSDKPVVIMQTIKFDADTYIRLVGIVREEDRAESFPRFRRVIDGLGGR